jgi:hypothetical protein
VGVASVQGLLVWAGRGLVITREERDAVLEGVAGRVAVVAERFANLYGTPEAGQLYIACRDEFRKLFALADVLGWEAEGVSCAYTIPDADYFLELAADYCEAVTESVAYAKRAVESAGDPGGGADGGLERAIVEQDERAAAILRAMLARRAL